MSDRGAALWPTDEAYLVFARPNGAIASRIIKEGLEAGVIVAENPGAAPKLMRYLPAWARPS